MKYEISGSWLDEIWVKNTVTGEEELAWREPPLDPQANMNYYFNKNTYIFQHKTDQMVGTVAPTDARWRKDVDYWEQGLEEESDNEKVKIE